MSHDFRALGANRFKRANLLVLAVALREGRKGDEIGWKKKKSNERKKEERVKKLTSHRVLMVAELRGKRR